MIEELRDRRLLSVVEDDMGLIGYRFAGPLFEAFELLDHVVVRSVSGGAEVCSHSSTTLLPSRVLDRIGFFDKLPCVPMHAVAHGASMPPRRSGAASEGGAPWVLSPSTCYHTFAHLAGIDEDWALRRFSSRGTCHRFEPAVGEPTRMGSFTMREVVLVGSPSAVEQECDAMFQRGAELLEALGLPHSIAVASDVFYGERSEVTRKVQLALGLKKEVQTASLDGAPMAVGSRNLHREVFTRAFDIGVAGSEPTMHSACVAFGLERLLLALLARVPDYEPRQLVVDLERAVPSMASPIASSVPVGAER